jgi:hypothetical protein
VALTQAEVDEFMACQKRVSARGRTMDWAMRGEYAAQWTAPIEVESEAVAQLFLNVLTNQPRYWQFKLRMAGEEVYRWDIRPKRGKHKNTGCPRGFPATVPEPEHEHLWIEGLACKCAKPLKGVSGTNHRETFAKFCTRIRLEFEPPYEAPPLPQLRLGS